jgi:DNA polymerase (family 10)
MGAALQYFTGSKDHNVRLRDIAKREGLKINEYGVFRGEERIAGEDEKDVYGALGLPWIPPELREDRGEIEAAAKGALPDLVQLSDIRGDLHAHTQWSDGAATVEELVLAAEARGYAYVAITDHTQALKVFGGLDEKGFREQLDEIEKVRDRHPDIVILAGAEVDIKADGSLDLADDMLEELDFVVASVHSGFSQRREEMTKRVLRAIQHPCVNVIGHPTGRVIHRRDPLQLDMEAIFEEAARRGVAMEINAYYQRLDLSDVLARRARDLGVKLVISTDAHALEHLDMMRFGVDVARRGWLEKKDILNCLPADELVNYLKKV